jgi:MFS family permease
MMAESFPTERSRRELEAAPSPRLVILSTTLTLAMAAGILLQVVFGALGPFLVEDLSLSLAEVGALTTALYLTGAILSPVGGRVVDRFEARRLLDLLFALSALTTLGVALAGDYWTLVVLALISGMGVAVANPVTNQIIAKAAPVRRQGLVTGIKQSGVQAWVFVGGAILPGIALLWNWRGAVVVAAAVPVVGLVCRRLSLAVRPDVHGDRGIRRARPTLPVTARWLSVYGFFIGCASSASGAYLPLFAVERLDEPAARAGMLTAVIGALGVVVRIGWGWRADRVPTAVAKSLAGMAFGACLAAGLIILAEPWGVAFAWAGAVLAGLTATAWNSVGMLAIVQTADADVRGRASATAVGAFYWGFVVGPLAFGVLVDLTARYLLGWLFVAACFLIAALVATLWAQRTRRQPYARVV